MRVVLLGAPNTGKGTYASRYLTQIYDIPHISTGDLFRENIKNKTDLGRTAQEYMDSGKLVPDDITTAMLKERLKKEDCKKGFFLDGFPRTVEQAEALEEITKIDIVINFVANKETLIRRRTGRRICKSCGAIYHVINIIPKVAGFCDECGGEVYQREDDKPEAAEERLKIYYEEIQPIIDFYEKKGKLANIDANLDVNDPSFHVIDDCRAVLDKIK